MIDTKTLTCANCHGGDFIRLGSNEFKCNHCGSITLVEDDVAQRLEQILRKLQSPAGHAQANADQTLTVVRIVMAIVGLAVLLAVLIPLLIGVSRHKSTPPPRPAPAPHRIASRPVGPPPLDPALVKISDLHVVDEGKRLVGMVRNDSDRVVNQISVTIGVRDGDVRKSNKHETMTDRLLPGESLPVTFWPWTAGTDEHFGVIEKTVGTDDDFRGRVQLDLAHQQLVREGDRLRFIGQLANNDQVSARSIRIKVTLFDADGRLIGYGNGSPESSQLARDDVTNFDVRIDRYANSEIASMQYLIDSDRVQTGDAR